MNPRGIGHRLFTDGVTRPAYEDERGQFIEADGERVDGVWLVPEEDRANTPIIVEQRERRFGSPPRKDARSLDGSRTICIHHPDRYRPTGAVPSDSAAVHRDLPTVGSDLVPGPGDLALVGIIQ